MFANEGARVYLTAAERVHYMEVLSKVQILRNDKTSRSFMCKLSSILACLDVPRGDFLPELECVYSILSHQRSTRDVLAGICFRRHVTSCKHILNDRVPISIKISQDYVTIWLKVKTSLSL